MASVHASTAGRQEGDPGRSRIPARAARGGVAATWCYGIAACYPERVLVEERKPKVARCVVPWEEGAPGERGSFAEISAVIPAVAVGGQG